MNGVNIRLFQFERDLTWMAFFMDANDQFYARYGGRDASSPEAFLSADSLIGLMERVLELHGSGEVQTSRYEPAAEPRRVPEEIPPMKAMIERRKEHKCIHCHDVKFAELRDLQRNGKFRRELVYTYPSPAAVGLEIDRDRQQLIRAVREESPAARAGFRPADRLLAVDGQRILSAADFSRVLELTEDDGMLPVTVERAGKSVLLRLELSPGWKQVEDPSWRETLHVAGPNGGFWGERLNEADRRSYKLPLDRMAVKVTFIWSDDTRRSGLQVGDIVTAFDRIHENWRINQLHAHLNLRKNYGEVIPVEVSRDGQRRELSLQLPSGPSDD
jgi:membrane-associated protease RseP (regulator of RpoE activity)